ncbi:DegV family protein [Atopobiaceae bacterium 24-176]
MAAACNLIVDSPCELSHEFCEQNGLAVLHFTYTEPERADGREPLCGVDDMFHTMSAHSFYDAMRHGSEPMTSQPSQMEFEGAFRAAIASGVPTVYLAFDSGISGCYEGACMALERMKEEFGQDIELYVVDTKLPSTPLTLLVWEAVRQRDKGLTARELADWAAEAHNYIHTLFMVDDLTALARGGRIPSGIAFVGSKLDIKPLLTVALDGTLELAGIARGRKKAIKRLAENYLKNHSETTFVCATANGDCPADMRRLEEVIERGADGDVLFVEAEAGPTIGCHVGPGFLSCSFWGADRREGMSVPDQIASEVRAEK